MWRSILLFTTALHAQNWDPQLSVKPTGEFSHAQLTVASSSQLTVQFTPYEQAAAYLLTARDSRSQVQRRAAAGDTSATFEDLKSATAYRISIAACLDENCDSLLESPAFADATTPAEYWRIVGRGNSYTTADRLVPDGNVGSYAFPYGPWGGDREGTLQLYYTPLQREEKGVKLAESIRPITSPSDATSFRGVPGYGVLRVCLPTPGPPGTPPQPPGPECPRSGSLATEINLFQAVPLTSGFVRLYFEATGFDGQTRILSLDSQDGYTGRDFHKGPATQCATIADLAPGGACEPTLLIGTQRDGDRGNPNLPSARQFKIAYQTRDSWLWDERPGTPMLFTTEWGDRKCSDLPFNAAYAVWNSEKWTVQYDDRGCPKILAGVQAPAPVHLGGARFKLYFSRHSRPNGPTDPRIAIKPVSLLYADPELSGAPEITDFEDWEPVESARPVRFYWPSGEELTQDAISRLDDFVVFAPTADPRQLIMYSNMSATGTNVVPFLGSAILINP